MGNSYRDLIVWQRAKALATSVYKETACFPRKELFGLVSQMRKAAVSVPSNIAEGQGRLTRGEFRHFLGQARGSLLELQTQAAIALELGYVTQASSDGLNCACEEVLHLINRLLLSLSPKR